MAFAVTMLETTPSPGHVHDPAPMDHVKVEIGDVRFRALMTQEQWAPLQKSSL